MIVLRDEDDDRDHRVSSIDGPDDRLIFEMSRFDVAPIVPQSPRREDLQLQSKRAEERRAKLEKHHNEYLALEQHRQQQVQENTERALIDP